MIGFRLALIAMAALAGASALAAPPSASSRLPKCSVAWSPLVSRGLHKYDYAKDARLTGNGNEGYAGYASRLNRRNCRKDWAVLVYMAADNDLTPYAYWDLYEMEAGYQGTRAVGGSTINTDLIVQLDTAGIRGVRRLHVFQTPEAYDDRLRKADFDTWTEESIRSPIVALLPEMAEAESSKLQKFLEWGMREYPADHYMVIVWGHGQGWAPSPAPREPARSRFLRESDVSLGPALAPVSPGPWAQPSSPFAERRFGGLAFNNSQGTYLDIPTLRATLKRVSQRMLGGRPIDVYASDACLMQMVEVATEMSDTARFIVGSTQVQNFLGLPYRRLMFELNTGRFAGERAETGSDDEAYLLARMIPKVFKASMAPNGLQGRIAPEGIKTITMSSISTSELDAALLPAMENLSQRLVEYLLGDPMRAMDVQFVLQHAPTFQGGAQELGAFLTLLRTLVDHELARGDGGDPEVDRLRRAIGEAKAALHRTVMNYALGTKYTGAEDQLYLMGFKAVSVWLPNSDRDLANRVEDFKTSAFYRRVSHWLPWLEMAFKSQ
jgi:hypothetical protein